MEIDKTQQAILSTLQDIKRATVLQAKNVLTTKECALLLGVSEEDVRRKCRKRLIPHFRNENSGIYYFNKREVEQWMQQNPVPTLTDINREASRKIYSTKY